MNPQQHSSSQSLSLTSFKSISHQSFIDWMKAFGMLLIVIGHVIGDPTHIFNQVTQPLYTKQLGVSFFVFVTGWGLANDSNFRYKVVFKRLFLIYFYGITAAIILSIIFFFSKGSLNLSNYLPFVGGINVFFNHFPANTTTWYIGLYVHLVLFWCFFLHRRTIGIHHLILAFLIENCARCVLISLGKEYIAYMILPNWITVFLLGFFLSQKKDIGFHPKVFVLAFIWVGILISWPKISSIFAFDESFPFRNTSLADSWVLPLRSVIISSVYIINTLLCFTIARHLPLLSIVSFFARNTLIIFIAHIPIIFNFSGKFYRLFETEQIVRQWLWIFVLYLGLGLASEIIQRSVNTRKLRELLWVKLTRILPDLEKA